MLDKIPNVAVIYEDNHIIAVNKPAGYLVHGDGGEGPVLADWVKAYIKLRYEKPGDVFLGVIHRLDRPVSGVVLFARTSKALERMNEMFKNREVAKTYFAITRELPPEESDQLIHWIVKDTEKNKSKAFEHKPKKYGNDAKEAKLKYEHMMTYAGLHLVKIEPETGRPHQIRVQLASINCIIKGDVKYGDPTPNKDKSICLHCQQLQFLHPVKKEMITIQADLPKGNGWQHFEIPEGE
jgi:23S rRNA pseudouridine1911/1915/1917 synthase